MTSICFSIEKLWCFWLNIIRYFFSPSYMPMHDMLKKKKICKENQKQKESKCFKYDCKRVSRRHESYRMYLEGNSPYQAVMIVCELNWFFHISNCHNMRHLCTLVMFSHTTPKFFVTCDTYASTMWFDHHKEYMY